MLEAQDLQLVADLHARETALAVAQVNLGYARFVAPADGTVRVPVKIALDDSKLTSLLRPGLSAIVIVRTRTEADRDE